MMMMITFNKHHLNIIYIMIIQCYIYIYSQNVTLCLIFGTRGICLCLFYYYYVDSLFLQIILHLYAGRWRQVTGVDLFTQPIRSKSLIQTPNSESLVKGRIQPMSCFFHSLRSNVICSCCGYLEFGMNQCF